MKRIPILALLIGCFILGLSCQKKDTGAAVDFATQIKPLLEARCINCHNAGALFGDLNLENRALAFKPRPKGGYTVIPGQPEKSPLYIVLTLLEPDKKAMPPTGHRIPPADVDLVKRWIKQGAKWPDGPDGTIKPQLKNDNPVGKPS